MKQSCRLRKRAFFASLQVEIGEQAPDADRQIAHQRLLDLAEPAHELRGQPARNAVGEQEVDVLLLQRCADSSERTVMVLSTPPGTPRFDGVGHDDTGALRHRARRRSRPRWSSCSRGWSCRRPSTARSPAMRAWRGGSPRWCRSTSTTRRSSSAPTERPDEVAARRRAGFERLSRALSRRASPRRVRLTRRGRRQHLRPAVHRRLPRAVPVQPLSCASTCAPAPFVQSSRRRDASPISTATASTT